MTYATSFRTGVRASELSQLAIDLNGLRRIEPRLLVARWVDPGTPRSGSTAQVAAAIRFAIPWVNRNVGPQRGIVTLLAYSPPCDVVYEVETPRGRARLSAHFADTERGSLVTINGWIVPNSRAHRVGLSLFSKVIRPATERALRKWSLQALEVAWTDATTAGSAAALASHRCGYIPPSRTPAPASPRPCDPLGYYRPFR